MLNPQYAPMDPSPPECDNSLFDRQFGVLVKHISRFAARKLSNSELLRCYSIPEDSIRPQLDEEQYTTHLDDILQYCIPYNVWISVTNAILDFAEFTDDIIFSVSELSDNFQCYYTKKSPTTVDWTEAYTLDPSTHIMLPII